MNEFENDALGISIGGDSFSEDDAQKHLTKTLERARTVISIVVEAFKEPWSKNPSTSVRAVLGLWVVNIMRHFLAIQILAEEFDLIKIADTHYRQMFEIMLQIRFITSAENNKRERLAHKVSAWGCVDYLEKMKRFKDVDFAKNAYIEEQTHLSEYDPDLVAEIKKERKQRNLYWFGSSLTRLANSVSTESEDLAQAYRIISAQVHGSWDVTLDVANPQPGILDFRGYPNKAQLYYWASELLDQASNLYIQVWNEVAISVGAPEVPSELEEYDSSPFRKY